MHCRKYGSLGDAPRAQNSRQAPFKRAAELRLRSTGVRDLLVFRQDYRCSHNVKLSAEYVDRWPDEIRISQLEPRFVCTACGKRGSLIIAGSDSTEMAIVRRKGPPP